MTNFCAVGVGFAIGLQRPRVPMPIEPAQAQPDVQASLDLGLRLCFLRRCCSHRRQMKKPRHVDGASLALVRLVYLYHTVFRVSSAKTAKSDIIPPPPATPGSIQGYRTCLIRYNAPR